MPDSIQNLRTAFHGFHRDDVVHLVEEMMSRHQTQVSQLEEEIARLEEELAAASPDHISVTPEHDPELDALRAENATLKAQIEELEEQLTATPEEKDPSADWQSLELASYRRAEAAERMARSRANQTYDEVNALADGLCARLENGKLEMDCAADSLGRALEALQTALESTQKTLQDGTKSMWERQIF